MATNKAKRPILLAQPKRHKSNRKTKANPTELMPVKAYVYRAIAELNGGFEKVVQELQTLRSVNYFNRERVADMRDLICRIRARANRDFTTAMREREKVNAGYFERMRLAAE